MEISVGGGASQLDLPVIPVGTRLVDGEELAAAQTDDEVDGSSLNIEVTAPVGRGYSGYFRYQFTEGDGSSRGGVQPGLAAHDLRRVVRHKR